MMKLLYYLDFDFFEKHHQSVTGDIYIRMPLGPVPKNADRILAQMRSEGLIKIEKKKMPEVGFNDKQLILPLKPATTENLSKEEIQMLDEIACKWEKLSGREMTSASHGEAPWIATPPNEEIDYNLTFYRNNFNEMAPKLVCQK
ncbi:MAG: Panacea domain-containing protein [Candidatus Aenigmatarchaeota archaeon]